MPKLKPAKVVKKFEKKPAAASTKSQAVPVVLPKVKATPEVLRGMRDILPNEWNYFECVIKKLENLAQVYGFGRIETPMLESSSLYIRGAGKYTDVVQKEMYICGDEEHGEMALRPEGTAGVARAYINHGMFNLPQPVKLYYTGSFFRRERPQAGRYREHHQFGFEIFGSDHPVCDAELIAVAHRFFKTLGIPVTFQVNSIGTPTSREKFIKELINYYKPKRKELCENCKIRLVRNPLRMLDCKEPQCVLMKADAPQIVDSIDEESKTHFMRVLEYLDDLEVPYQLNAHLVRGFDYYTKTVFEIWPEEGETSAQVSLGGGGRYDNLVEVLGGRPTKSVGMSLGIERVINKMKELQIRPPARNSEIFLAQLGEAARKIALKMISQLEETGFRVHVNFSKDGLREQLEQANKIGAKIVLILGQQEVQDGTVIIREMDTGMQESVDVKKLTLALQKRLPKPE